MKLLREKNRQLSFCITCMGRLSFLKKTLEHNLTVTQPHHDQIEFVILNYNSKDGLDDWIKNNFMSEIREGLVKYAYNKEPRYFHMAHAKNMAHRLGNGNILCNLDADNRMQKHFTSRLLSHFNNNPEIVVQVARQGTLAVSKNNFYKIDGYSENVLGYAAEDEDFRKRLKFILNIKYIHWKKHRNVYVIPHPAWKRWENYPRGYKGNRKTIGKEIFKKTFSQHCNNGRYGCGAVFINFSDIPTVLDVCTRKIK